MPIDSMRYLSAYFTEEDINHKNPKCASYMKDVRDKSFSLFRFVYSIAKNFVGVW